MKKRWMKKAAASALMAVMTVSLIGCGSVKMTTKGTEDSTRDTTVKMLSSSDVVGKETNEKLETIQGILDKNFYFEEDEQEKQDGIIKGYMEGLDDPYSVYYTAEEYASFMEDTEGEYVGVGRLPDERHARSFSFALYLYWSSPSTP